MTPKQVIEKDATFIKRLMLDKKLHYFAGLLIAGLLIAGLLIAGLLTNFLPVLIAVAIAVAVGIGKEVYDRVTKKGTPEFADFLWTTAGALTWLLLYYAVSGIVWAFIK